MSETQREKWRRKLGEEGEGKVAEREREMLSQRGRERERPVRSTEQ